MKAGVREFRDRLSYFLKRVRAGKELILTDRGKPIAVIKPIRAKDPWEEKLIEMEAKGLIRLPTKPGPPRGYPLRMKGKRLSQLVIEEREKW
ncbi:MAG: type II toxin-antitoxin system prevent-host-death family antitoxin [Deltaproteobacteria bacterium]|nr:type II toxin-antitoxin system prevent-host-death family antitoxin [Deltaproteobacteria bacterium]